MADEGAIPDLVEYPRAEAISIIAYHARLLQRAGLIEVVARIPKRGSEEIIYRAVEGVHHTTEEWEELPRADREGITTMTLSTLVGLAEAAIHYGSFNDRIDRHLAYVPFDIDEQGWKDLGPVLDGVLEIVMRVKDEAEKRLATSGERAIRVVYGGMLFESPALPEAPQVNAQSESSTAECCSNRRRSPKPLTDAA